MNVIGVGSDYSEWLQPAILLGWICSVLSMIVYIIALPLAIYRDEARQFWSDWCPLNFGLTLFAVTLMFTRIEMPIVLAWPCFLGVGMAVALHRWRGTTSRHVLILVNVMLLAPTLPFLARYWEVMTLSLATTFIIVPALHAARIDRIDGVRLD